MLFNRISFIVLLCTIGIFSSCKDDVDENPQLRVVVIDNSSSIVSECNVQLFTTEEDWINKTNIVQSASTDSKGEVLFSDLEELQYYIFAKKDRRSNYYTTNLLENPLESNVRTLVTISIR